MTSALWLDILSETIDACTAHERHDLARRLRLLRDQPAVGVRVAVIGFPNHGKSTLVNALLNAPVCAADDATSTAVPTEVGHTDEPTATLVYSGTSLTSSEQRTPTDFADLPAHLTHSPADRATAYEPGDLTRVEIGVPRAILARGLTVIDTPAVREPHPRAALALDVLARSHAAVLVTDAADELSVAELALITHVRTWCPNVVLAMTKTDIHPRWRETAERNRLLLADGGVRVAVLPVSSVVRLQAARTTDRDLNRQSGIPDLLSWIETQIARPVEHSMTRLAAVACRAALQELVDALRAQIEAPAVEQGITQVLRMQLAQRRVDELRRHTTRWQNMLADEIADLTADVDYDLRDRARRIIDHIDVTFDDADPQRSWALVQDWLEQALAEAIATTGDWLDERATWISRAVAETFPHSSQHIQPDVRPSNLSQYPDATTQPATPRIDAFTLGQKAFTGLRGSYGGVLMFGLVTSLAGMALINPISLGAGAAFAAKSIRDESEVRLSRRQAVAKSAAQRHVDDVLLRFTKECRDRIRDVHRGLRDHFGALSQELLDDETSSREAVQTGAVHRDRRVADLKRELDRLATLHKRAGDMGIRREPAASAKRTPTT